MSNLYIPSDTSCYEYTIYEPLNMNDNVCLDYEDKKIIVKKSILDKYKNMIETNLYTLNNIPIPLRTYDICKLSIDKNIENIKFIPEHIFTYDFCDYCIKISGFCLQYIPEKFKSIELCILALKNNTIYNCIPNNFIKYINIINHEKIIDVQLPETSDAD